MKGGRNVKLGSGGQLGWLVASPSPSFTCLFTDAIGKSSLDVELLFAEHSLGHIIVVIGK